MAAGGSRHSFPDYPSGWHARKALDKLRRKQDVVVLDTLPQAGTDAKLAIRAMDFVLTPLQPSPANLWASEGTWRLAAEEQRLLRALLNRVPAQDKICDRVVAALAEQEMALLEQSLGNRAQFGAASLYGLFVTEAAPRSAPAADMRALATAVPALAGDR